MPPLCIRPEQIIDLLPEELQHRLEADDYFCDIPVIAADEGNVEATVKAKQALQSAKGGKIGAAVIVLQMVADDNQPNLLLGPMSLRPAFQVIEQRELNRGANGTKKPARQIARRIRDVIKTFVMADLITTMRPGQPCIFGVNNHPYGENVLLYQVEFECLENVGTPEKQVQLPVIANVPETLNFSITSTTVGATIFYTTDDSYPWSGNPKALIYADPQPVPVEGLTVRACAYAPGMLASVLTRAYLTIN